MLIVASALTPTLVGLEASAAAKQVKPGFDYLQARAEMQTWPMVVHFITVAGGVLIAAGVIRSLLPTKTNEKQ